MGSGFVMCAGSLGFGCVFLIWVGSFIGFSLACVSEKDGFYMQLPGVLRKYGLVLDYFLLISSVS